MALSFEKLLILLGCISAQSWDLESSHPCNIQQFSFNQLKQRFPNGKVPRLFPNPLIILGNEKRNSAFRNITQRETLLDFFGPDFEITLTSSNSLSEKRRHTRLQTYLDELQEHPETSVDQLANETWYLFGETYSKDWQRLHANYELPICATCQSHPVALAFGIGNAGSGVQWHIHGPGFSEAIHGRKHWILAPPEDEPMHHKDQSSRQWMEVNDSPSLMQCTLQPGDMIYFPDKWWHATINLDPYTVFMSSFTTEHGTLDDEL